MSGRNLIVTAAMAAIGLASFASEVCAQDSVTDWSGDHFDVVGSAPGEDNEGCIMTSTFTIEGRSSVKFGVFWNGDTAAMVLTSLDWSAVKDREYDGFAYYFSDSESLYDGGKTIGYVSDLIYKGFMATFPPEFLDRLAADSRLVVARQPAGEEMVIVADLNLSGSAQAVAALRRCATHVVAREEGRRRRESRNDYIERDPFAD